MNISNEVNNKIWRVFLSLLPLSQYFLSEVERWSVLSNLKFFATSWVRFLTATNLLGTTHWDKALITCIMCSFHMYTWFPQRLISLSEFWHPLFLYKTLIFIHISIENYTKSLKFSIDTLGSFQILKKRHL